MNPVHIKKFVCGIHATPEIIFTNFRCAIPELCSGMEKRMKKVNKRVIVTMLLILSFLLILAILLTGVQQHTKKEETGQLGTEEMVIQDNKTINMVLTEQTQEEGDSIAELNNAKPITEIKDLDYSMLIGCGICYDVAAYYTTYSVIGKESPSWESGEILYGKWQEKLTGRTPDIKEEYIKEGYAKGEITTGSSRYDNENNNECLVDISPDGEYAITEKMREPGDNGDYIIKVYRNGNLLHEVPKEFMNYHTTWEAFGKEISAEGIADAVTLQSRKFPEVQEDIDYGNRIINREGSLIAAAEDKTINIYDTDNGELLQSYSYKNLPLPYDDWIEMSQLEGGLDSGFLLFNNDVRAYRMALKDGSVEMLGDYIFSPQISPDGRHLVFCSIPRWYMEVTNNIELWEVNELIPSGVYLKNLSTGEIYYTDIQENDCRAVSIAGVSCRWLDNAAIEKINKWE